MNLVGIYPRIPSQYSQDLEGVVRQLLQVSAPSRPTCEKILRFKSIESWCEKLFPNNDNIISDEQNILLKTIKFPKNILNLTDQLPKATYCINSEAKNRNTTDDSLKFPNILKKENTLHINPLCKNNKISKIKELKEEYECAPPKSIIHSSNSKPSIEEIKPLNISNIIHKIGNPKLYTLNSSNNDTPVEILPRQYNPSIERLKAFKNSLISNQMKIKEKKSNKSYESPILISGINGNKFNIQIQKAGTSKNDDQFSKVIEYYKNGIKNNNLIAHHN